MKILVLEDSEERIAIFRKKLATKENTFLVAMTVPACIKALESQKWNYLFLDHDLNGKVYVQSDGEELTGWHVAKWLSENPEHKPENMIVHSLNESGRKNIISLLPEAKEIPFAWQLINSEA